MDESAELTGLQEQDTDVVIDKTARTRWLRARDTSPTHGTLGRRAVLASVRRVRDAQRDGTERADAQCAVSKARCE